MNKIHLRSYLHFFIFALAFYLLILAIDSFKMGWEVIYSNPSLKLSIQNNFSTLSNPIIFLFYGVIVTSLMQSSSSSIALMIAAVASGAMSVNSAVFYVFGANIGTSLVNSIVCLTYIQSPEKFSRALPSALLDDIIKIINVCIFLSLELAFSLFSKMSYRVVHLFESLPILNSQWILINFDKLTYPILFFIKQTLKLIIEDSFISIFFIVMGILLIQASVRLFSKSIQKTIDTFSKSKIMIFHNGPIKTFIMGFGLCWFFQSSSITLSLALPAMAEGAATLRQIFYYSLGASLATTCDFGQLLSYSRFGIIGFQVGFIHILLNLFAVLLFGLFPFVTHAILKLVEKLSSYISNSQHPAVFLIIYILGFYFGLPLFIVGIF